MAVKRETREVLVCSDGEVFHDTLKAEAHERRLKLHELVDKHLPGYETDSSEVVDFLIEHRHAILSIYTNEA